MHKPEYSLPNDKQGGFKSDLKVEFEENAQVSLWGKRLLSLALDTFTELLTMYPDKEYFQWKQGDFESPSQSLKVALEAGSVHFELDINEPNQKTNFSAKVTPTQDENITGWIEISTNLNSQHRKFVFGNLTIPFQSTTFEHIDELGNFLDNVKGVIDDLKYSSNETTFTTEAPRRTRFQAPPLPTLDQRARMN